MDIVDMKKSTFLQTGDTHHSFVVDVSSCTAVGELMTCMTAKFSGCVPSIVVCAAGIAIIHEIINTTEDDFDNLVSVHLKVFI